MYPNKALNRTYTLLPFYFFLFLFLAGGDYGILNLKKSDKKITNGVTVIIHGFNPDVIGSASAPQWTFEMADAIMNRLGGSDNVTIMTNNAEGLWEYKNGNTNLSGEIILVYNWSNESDKPANGWAEAAGDNLFASIFGFNNLLKNGVNPNQPIDLMSRPFHFICHSRGNIVALHSFLRFKNIDKNIERFTALDPHPSFGPMNDILAKFVVGTNKQEYSIALPQNVIYASDYFRRQLNEDGTISYEPIGYPNADPFDFAGVPFANNSENNFEICESTLEDGGSLIEHSDIHEWYYGTINIYDNQIPSSWYTKSFKNQTGSCQDIFYNRSTVGFNKTPSQATTYPMHSPTSFFNGDFTYNSVFGIPGWQLHGGATKMGSVVDNKVVFGPSFSGALTDIITKITSNYTYIPDSASISFTTETNTSDNTLQVTFDDILIESIPLSGIKTHIIKLPAGVKKTVRRVSFNVSNANNSVTGKVSLDNIKFTNEVEVSHQLQILPPANIVNTGTDFSIGLKLVAKNPGGLETGISNKVIGIHDPITKVSTEITTDQAGVAIYPIHGITNSSPGAFTFEFFVPEYDIEVFSNIMIGGSPTSNTKLINLAIERKSGSIEDINSSYPSRLFNYLSKKHPDANQSMINLLTVDFLQYIQEDVNGILDVSGKIRNAVIDDFSSESNQKILINTVKYCSQASASECLIGLQTLAISTTESALIAAMRETLKQLLIQIQRGPTNNKLFSDETLNTLNKSIDAGVFAFDVYSSIDDLSAINTSLDIKNYINELNELLATGRKVFWQWDDVNQCVMIAKNDTFGITLIGFKGKILPTCSDGIQNGNETGIDCGGPTCLPCKVADYAYIQCNPNIVVHDVNNYNQVKNISLGNRPDGSNFSNDGSLIIFCNGYSDDISIVSTTSNTEIARKPVGDYPSSAKFSPDGSRLYVSHLNSNDIYVLNSSDYSLITKIPCGGSLRDIELSLDGKWLYAAVYTTNKIAVINTLTYAITNTISVGSGPYSLDIAPKLNKLVVSNYVSNSLSFINLVDFSVQSLNCGNHPLVIKVNRENTKVYVATSSDNKVRIVDLNTRTIIKEINTGVGTNPYGLSINYKKNELWVSNSFANTISIIDLTTETITKTISTGTSPYCALGDFIFDEYRYSNYFIWYKDFDNDGYAESSQYLTYNPGTGYTSITLPLGDCNDDNASIHPGVSDSNCNSIDENCNGTADEGYVAANCLTCQNGVIVNIAVTWYLDADGDGHAVSSTVACTSPGNGYTTTLLPIDDCNDNNGSVHPGASDANCNGIDENCNGTADEGYVAANCLTCQNGVIVNTAVTWYLDADGDGHAVSSTVACTSPGNGYTTTLLPIDDCNDNNGSVHPGASDTNCNGIDENCNGTADEGYDAANCLTCQNGVIVNTAVTWYLDADSDGHAVSSTVACTSPGNGYTTTLLPIDDCNDINGSVHPGASDANCNGIDENCNGTADEGYVAANCLTCQNGVIVNTAVTWYLDADGDGHAVSSTVACTSPGNGYISVLLPIDDCDDNNASVHPGASDANCNGKDDDCDGATDEDFVPTACYSCINGRLTSIALTGLNSTLTDFYQVKLIWDRVPEAISYSLEIRLNGTSIWQGTPFPITTNEFTIGNLNWIQDTLYDWRIKANCNISTQPTWAYSSFRTGKCSDFIKTYYIDIDGDGFASAILDTCFILKSGYSTNIKPLGDCNDENASIHPNAVEVCNGIDDNCNGQIDENDCHTYLWFPSAWSNCSAICGPGTQTRTVNCYDENGALVAGSLCDPNTKPTISQSCNEGPCHTYNWVASAWDNCSAICGPGTQTRTVNCYDENGALVAGSLCDPNTKPTISQSCNEGPCHTYNWIASAWGNCSAICGPGTQTRTVNCYDETGALVAGSLCDPNTKPTTSQSCNESPCHTYNWVASAWGNCSAICGPGTQTRTVNCYDENGALVAGSLCDPNTKPTISQSCNESPCHTYNWVASAWGNCSAICGPGTQTRTVNCYDETGALVTGSLCDPNTKPTISQSCTINSVPLSALLIVTQPTCNLQTGSIQVVNKSVADSVSFNNGLTYQISNAKPGLIPGNYTIKIKTEGGCISSSASATINDAPSIPATPLFTLVQPTCSIPSGSITITNKSVLDSISFNNGISYQISNVKSGVIPGNYILKIKTVGSCISSSATATINAVPSIPATPLFTLVQPTCLIPSGTITITNKSILDSVSFNNGVSYQISNIKPGLIPGNHILKIKTVGSCISSSATVTINALPSIPATPLFTLVQPTCLIPSGTITVTNKSVLDSISFNNGISYQISNVKSGLIPGNYILKIKTSSGCVSLPSNAFLNTVSLVVTINNVDTAYYKSSPTFSMAGTPIAGTFKIDGVVNTNFSPFSLSLGVHTVTYTVTIGSCTATVAKQVKIKQISILGDPNQCFTIENYRPIVSPFFPIKLAGTSGDSVLQQSVGGSIVQSQKWIVLDSLGYKRIKNKSSGLYLRVRNGNIAQGAFNSPAAEWTIALNTVLGTYSLVNRSNGKYFNANNNGTYSLETSNILNQNFSFNPVICTASANVDVLESRASLIPKIELYPNPSEGAFTVRFKDIDLTNETHLTIYSIIGTKIWETIILNNDPVKVSLNDVNSSNGLYVLVLKNSNMFLEKKFIIQR